VNILFSQNCFFRFISINFIENPHQLTAAKSIELNHDGLDKTTFSLNSTSVSGQLRICAFFCDLSSKINIDSALTEGVSDDQKVDNVNHNIVNEESVDNSQWP